LIAVQAVYRTRTPWVAVGVRAAVAAGAAVLVAVLTSLFELALLAGLAIGAEAWRVISEPAAVTLTDDGLVTEGRLRRRRVIPWASISELVCRPDTDRPSSVRILASAGQVRLSRRNEGFDAIVSEIRARVPRLAVSKRVWHRG
jgi:hypothetical protein